MIQKSVTLLSLILTLALFVLLYELVRVDDCGSPIPIQDGRM